MVEGGVIAHPNSRLSGEYRWNSAIFQKRKSVIFLSDRFLITVCLWVHSNDSVSQIYNGIYITWIWFYCMILQMLHAVVKSDMSSTLQNYNSWSWWCMYHIEMERLTSHAKHTLQYRTKCIFNDDLPHFVLWGNNTFIPSNTLPERSTIGEGVFIFRSSIIMWKNKFKRRWLLI